MQFPDRGRKPGGSHEHYKRPLIEKCSSPTGDGNRVFDDVSPLSFVTIEKCSSPTGDGNTLYQCYSDHYRIIEKCSSPTGDGNNIAKANN